MKVLVCADLHIGVSSFGVVQSDGRNSRLIDVEKALHRAIDIAIEQGVELFICCGDVFHTNKPAADQQLVFWRVLQRLGTCNFHSRFIIGNHDYDSKPGANHALKLFMEILSESDRIKIYDTTSWESFYDNCGKPFLVCFYPYKGQEPDYSVRTGFGEVHATAIVCHSHLEGAVVGAEPFEIKDDKATKFRDLPVDFVFAGHFHKPQVLCDAPMAFYPGSIQPVDFNERFDVKGVVIVDTIQKTRTAAGIASRRFIQLDIDGTTRDIKLGSTDLFEVEDAIVKVNLKIHESQSSSFDENVIRKTLMEAGAHSIAGINLDIVRAEVKRNSAIRLDSTLAANFETFIKDRDYGLYKDAVKVMGLEIIKQHV